MKEAIYVDLDDVLGQTGRTFLRLVEARYGRRLEFEELTTYDLGRSLGLDRGELAEFMDAAHEPEVLDAIEPFDGAAGVLSGWLARGYEVWLVTGRPPATEGATRAWLDRHRLPHTSLSFVDKYSATYPDIHRGFHGGRDLGELLDCGFRLAVEDSLEMAALLAERLEAPVALFDRPWNRDLSPLGSAASERIVRCRDWADISRRFEAP